MSEKKIQQALILEELKRVGDPEAVALQEKLYSATEDGSLEAYDPQGNIRMALAARYAGLQSKGSVRPIQEISEDAKKMAGTKNNLKI